uniref:E3 ubiquitin-protein ligase n=1 Tax=Anopheles atroparvus TaxID=41427 RepID=A0A182JMA2_ANOAO
MESPPSFTYLRDSWRRYDEALRQFPSPEPPHDYRHLTALGRTIVHETLLEEFIFWTFKYEFQQQIVCFLLNMLPDQDYKEHLTRTFVMHYCRIPSVLELSNDPDTLSNRVVHMSVQLFSNESLALKMVEELSLLHVMIISLRQMMSKILTPHTLHNPVRNFHYVVDCAERVMKEHCYWPLVSDFNNVLSHESVALVFLKDDDLIDMWFQFLSMLQGMNVNIREIISHVEYESSSYYAAFSCELEASAYPMWSIISHLRDPSHAPLAKKIMMYCVNYLQDWLDAVNFCQNPKFEKYEMSRASFHFPLHRYLAAFICQGVKTMGMSLNDILPSADLLPMLMMHPLRVQFLAECSSVELRPFQLFCCEPIVGGDLDVRAVVVREQLRCNVATGAWHTLVQQAGARQRAGSNGVDWLRVQEWDGCLGSVHATPRWSETQELATGRVRQRFGRRTRRNVLVQQRAGGEVHLRHADLQVQMRAERSEAHPRQHVPRADADIVEIDRAPVVRERVVVDVGPYAAVPGIEAARSDPLERTVLDFATRQQLALLYDQMYHVLDFHEAQASHNPKAIKKSTRTPV